MGSRYCNFCGTPVADKYNRYCNKCQKIEQQMLSRVKSHLKYNASASIDDVSRKTGVDKKHINRYIREGKIVISLSCSNCGKPVSSAVSQNLCDKCKRNVFKQMKCITNFKNK